jgi:hypothetical protein
LLRHALSQFRQLTLPLKALAVLSAIAIVVGFTEVARHLWYEAQGVLSGDADIYFTVGRGLLNGLVPYRDIFENKPPGIFLVTAASLWITGGALLAKVLQILALLSPFAAILWWASRQSGWLLKASGALLATVVLLFTATYAGEVQVEAFGLAFACWYPFLLWYRRDDWRVRDTALAAGLFAFSIGFKEPFLLTLIATALLLCPGRRSFIQRCVIPALIATVAGGLLLGLLGWLHSYLWIYLHFMLQGHIVRTGPVWLRGFEAFGLLKQAWSYSPALPAFLLLLFGARAVTVWKDQWGAKRTFTLVQFALASYLLILTIGLGGYYYGHHYLFPLPGYLALWLHFASSDREAMTRHLQAAVLILLACIALLHLRLDYRRQLADWRSDHTQKIEVAAETDRVMDACGVERYLHLVNKGAGPYGWTLHSPAGPVFLLYTRFPIKGSDIAKHFKEDRLVLMRDAESAALADEALQYLSVRFTEDPWPCAAPLHDIAPYRLLFRRQIDLTDAERARVQSPAPAR